MNENAIKIGKVIALLVVLYIAINVAWSAYEHYTIRVPLQELRQSDEQFKNVSVDVRYPAFMNSDILIFDVKKIDKPGKLIPFEFLLAYAKKMNDKEFEEVRLQYKGKTKYILPGMSFVRIGTEIQMKKPEQIMEFFPPLLKKPNGLPVFHEPHGDEQWVAQKKEKNFRDFIMGWYLEDWIKETGKKIRKKKSAKTPAKTPQTTPTGATPTVTKTDGPPRIEPEDI